MNCLGCFCLSPSLYSPSSQRQSEHEICDLLKITLKSPSTHKCAAYCYFTVQKDVCAEKPVSAAGGEREVFALNPTCICVRDSVR